MCWRVGTVYLLVCVCLLANWLPPLFAHTRTNPIRNHLLRLFITVFCLFFCCIFLGRRVYDAIHARHPLPSRFSNPPHSCTAPWQAASNELKHASLECLGFLCQNLQDVEYEEVTDEEEDQGRKGGRGLSQEQTNQVLTAIVDGMRCELLRAGPWQLAQSLSTATFCSRFPLFFLLLFTFVMINLHLQRRP